MNNDAAHVSEFGQLVLDWLIMQNLILVNFTIYILDIRTSAINVNTIVIMNTLSIHRYVKSLS